MPRRVDKTTGVKEGKAQTGKYKGQKRYGKYAKPFKKGEQLPESERSKPTWDEEKQRWTNKRGDPICGASRTGRSAAGPGVCCQLAGWGTDHVGIGQCKNHGGTTATLHTKAMVAQVLEGASGLWGSPVNISPEDAMLQEVHRTQGAVVWLAGQLAELPASDHHKPYGHYLIDKFQEERAHLVAVCKAAITMGIAQKQVELAQEQGKLLAAVLQAFVLDPELELTPAQRTKVPELLRKHLTTIPTMSSPQPQILEIGP